MSAFAREGYALGLALLAWIAPACEKKVPEPEPPPRASTAATPAATSKAPLPDEMDEPAHALADADSSVTPPDAASKKTVSKLEKKDQKPGTGLAAKAGDTVRVHYTGRLMNGTKFDSSLDRNEPFEFTLGQGQVIKGWDEGVVGMKKGGKRKLTIPSDMAYGKLGSPPKIPPDAPLEFDIELLEIKSR